MDKRQADPAVLRRGQAALRLNELSLKKARKEAVAAAEALAGLEAEFASKAAEEGALERSASETRAALLARSGRGGAVTEFRRKFDFLSGCYIMASHARRSLNGLETAARDASAEHERLLQQLIRLKKKEARLEGVIRSFRRLRSAAGRSIEFSEAEERFSVSKVLFERECRP